MVKKRNRFLIAIVVFVVWAAIVILSPKFQFGGGDISLDELVSKTVVLGFVAASVFLLAVVAAFGWWQNVGLHTIGAPKKWLILLPPCAIVIALLGLSVFLGLPPSSVVLFMFINTILVGFHEELMCRGIFFQGALQKLTVWPAIIITSVVFGLVHALNGFLTGDYLAASVQSLAATVSGLWLLAVRLRTGSLVPAIVIHFLWDFALFIVVRSAAATAAKAVEPAAVSGPKLFLPVLLVLPLGLYGLYLLRRIGDKTEQELLA